MMIVQEVAHLQLVEIIAELLETLLEGDEACGDLRGRCASRLHHLLLVQKGLEAKLELLRG